MNREAVAWAIAGVVLVAMVALAVWIFFRPMAYPCGAPVGGSSPGQMVCPEANP